jgi:LysM repeat protein
MKRFLKLPLRRLSRRPPPSEALHAKTAADSNAYEEEDYDAAEEPNMKFSHALIVVLALHVIAVGGVFAFNSIKARQSSTAKTSAKSESATLPSAAAAQSKTSSAQPDSGAKTGKTHSVQAGDTLSRIAALHKVSVESLEKENGITSFSMIRVGQLLKIPAPESATAKPEPAKPTTDPATAAAKQAFLAAKSDMGQPSVPPKPESAKAVSSKPHAMATASPAPAHPQPSATKVEAPPTASGSDTYVVAKGDNPYSIAKKLKVSYNELIAINEIKDPTRVQIGQKLKIPAKKN